MCGHSPLTVRKQLQQQRHKRSCVPASVRLLTARESVPPLLGVILNSFPPVSPRFCGVSVVELLHSQSVSQSCLQLSVGPCLQTNLDGVSVLTGLTTVSVFDLQVFVFFSLLYWALQSVTQLLAIKKKTN